MGKDTQTSSVVFIYHDETKNVNAGKYRGHVFFFVPQVVNISHNHTLFGVDAQSHSVADLLHRKICELRDSYGLSTKKLHFTDISGKQWGKSDEGHRVMLEILVDALRHKYSQIFEASLSCKLAVIFYPNKSDVEIYGGTGKEQYLRHDETVMRMLLKKALHSLYDDYNRVRIDAIYTDGQPMHRPLDDARVIDRLKHDEQYGRKPLREYVDLADTAQLIGIDSDHTKYDLSNSEYKHANFLQLTDLLLGAVIKSCYSSTRRCKNLPRIGTSLTAQDKKAIVAYPIIEMLEKKKRGAGFKNSGHYKSFTLSEVTFENSKPEFKELKTRATIFQNTPEFDFGL
jgi:hypothetical protein